MQRLRCWLLSTAVSSNVARPIRWPAAAAVRPLCSVSAVDDVVLIAGNEWTHMQSRENCRCAECWYSFGQRRDISVKVGIRVTSVGVAQQGSSLIPVTWSDGHQGLLPTQLPTSITPDISHDLTAEPWGAAPSAVCLDGAAVLAGDPVEQAAVFQQVQQHGLVRLMGTPQERGTVERVVEALGMPVWPSVFGRSFHVESQPAEGQPGNQAYTPNALPLHTDLSGYQQPPGESAVLVA